MLMITAIISAVISIVLGVIAEALVEGLGAIVCSAGMGAVIIALIEQKK